MILVADTFVTNNRRPALFQTDSFYRNDKALVVKSRATHLEVKKGKFPTFAVFLETNIQQTKIISRSTISLFISTMRSSHFYIRRNLRNTKKELKYEKEDFF